MTLLIESTINSRVSGSSDSFGGPSWVTGTWIDVPLDTDVTIDQIQFVLFKSSGTTADLTCMVIETNSSRVPTGTTFGSTTIPASSVPTGSNVATDGGWVSFDFSTPLSIPADTYFIAYLKAPAGTTTSYTFPLSADGFAGAKFTNSGNNGSTFSYATNSFDLGFRIYGEQAATQTSPSVTLDTPTDTASVSDTTPELKFTGTDADNDDVTYQVQVDTDSGFATPPIDALSDTDTGFANLDTPADTDPFTSGEQVGYTVQSALTEDTTYYWRVRSKDPSGTNEWGDWTTAQSFTISADGSGPQAKVSGSFTQAVTKVKVDGEWVDVTVKLKVDGEWVEVG